MKFKTTIFIAFMAVAAIATIKSTFPADAAVRHEGIRTLCGDINADGVVNIVDAMYIAQFAVGLRDLPEGCSCRRRGEDD